MFIFYLKVGLETPQNQLKLGKGFCTTAFEVGMDLKKAQRQDKDEGTKMTTLHLKKYTADVGYMKE